MKVYHQSSRQKAEKWIDENSRTEPIDEKDSRIRHGVRPLSTKTSFCSKCKRIQVVEISNWR